MTTNKIIIISNYTKSSLASIKSKNESYDEIINRLIEKWKEKETINGYHGVTSYQCKDNKFKKRRLIFDGGSAGPYSLDLCQDCYLKQNKKFLIEEMSIDETQVQ